MCQWVDARLCGRDAMLSQMQLRPPTRENRVLKLEIESNSAIRIP